MDIVKPGIVFCLLKVIEITYKRNSGTMEEKKTTLEKEGRVGNPSLENPLIPHIVSRMNYLT